MKTRIYTTAMLMAMFLGNVSINAQRARRNVTQEKKEQTTATRTHTRLESTKKARTTQPARQVQKQQVQRQRATQPARRYRNSRFRGLQIDIPVHQGMEEVITEIRNL